MAQYFPLSHVHLVETLTLYDFFTIPVFSIDEIQSASDLNSLKSGNEDWIYGSPGESCPLDFLQGSLRTYMAEALAIYKTLDFSSPSTTFLNEQINYYGNNSLNLVGFTSTSNSSSFKTISATITMDTAVGGAGYLSPNIMLISQYHVENSDGVKEAATNGCYGGSIIKFNENGIDYYVRLGISFLFSQIGNDYPCSISYQLGFGSGNRNADFWGSSYIPIKLNQIGNGTAVVGEPVIGPTNPYNPIDPSGPSEGEGTFDFDSDPVPLPPIPTLSSSNTGFTRIFNPTLSQVQQLANYLWTDESFFKTVWNQIKQVFDDPISAIIAFNLVPVAVPDAGNVEFKLMYIPTGVTMNVAASQFVDVDCGTLTVERVYGSALDYSPYTKISCFLPFVGTVTLNTDEVMNRTLQVKYRVDICSGACVAIILVDGTVMYQFTGHCAINIPMNGADFSTYVSALTAAAKIGLGAATGAGLIAAAAPVPEVTQTTSQTTTRKTERNPETGRQITSWTKDVQRNVEETVTKASHDGLTPANVANTVGSVMGSKPYIERSGSFTGNSGYLGVRRPYLIIERPNLCMPANFQSLNGFPAMMTLPLSSCKGFTRVQQVQLTKCTATNPEQAEILEFLKAGVYL